MNQKETNRLLAIIPARGVSKGIPRKNLHPLLGKPLLGYTIESASLTRLIDRIIVSTDDDEIASVAKKYGADVVRRPHEICGDSATSESALLHVLEYLKESESYLPEIFVFLQCTSPLTLPEDIDGTIRALVDTNADCGLSVAPFHYFLWHHDGDNGAVGINHDKRGRLLRQEREPQFLETGAVYAMRTQGFRAAKHRFFGKTALYVMPRERCLEIDEPGDLLVAEALLLSRRERGNLSLLPMPLSALVLDFDGVFTDNRVLVSEDGREAVICDRRDGWGLAELKSRGLPILVLSSEENTVVRKRCDKLGIDCIQGVRDKCEVLLKWLEDRTIDPSRVVYVGNDVNDVPCLNRVGCGVVVADAHPVAVTAAKIVLSRPGGRGAIREIADLIMRATEGRNHASWD